MWQKKTELISYPFNDYRNYLQHHGIQGMRWGERKAPWYPIADYEAHLKRVGDNGEGTLSRDQRLALSNLKTSKTSNLEKFGRSPKTNVLYIAGYSGSGKSTTALGLKRTGDTIIHLDAYSESSSELVKIRNRKFNEYLSNHGFNYKKLAMELLTKESFMTKMA